MWRSLFDNGYWQGEIWNRRKNGEIYPELLTITAIQAEQNGEISHYIGIFSDISKSKTDEEHIRQLAFYDPLTGLANRRRLLDRLEHELALSLRHKTLCALVYFDLDHFKSINDTLGHSFGDAVLIETAKRLLAILRDTDTIARLGGDEFVAILPCIGESKQQAGSLALDIAEKIQMQLNLPYWVEDQEVFLAASIGITLFPEKHNHPLELLKQADTAMYRAKEEGGNQIRFYQQSMQESAKLRFLIMDGLRHALKNNGYCLHYQPQMDHLGTLIGAEALLRWRHPEHGEISPAQFIPVAEESNLIVPIGNWVINQALFQLQQWNLTGFYLPKLAINISPRQFYQKGFIDNLSLLINHYGITPQQIMLEITEGLLLDNVEEAIKRMTRLKQLGFSFSVDDFGTGYSSLSYLHNLPLDQLKIDKSFVQGISNGQGKTVIIDTIIAMAKYLGFSVIAEGVEHSMELEFLQASGCLQYQGYYFSPPLPSAAFLTYCKTHTFPTPPNYRVNRG
jgi:diguanylate cyclase (GGDEF)-like protein